MNHLAKLYLVKKAISFRNLIRPNLGKLSNDLDGIVGKVLHKGKDPQVYKQEALQEILNYLKKNNMSPDTLKKLDHDGMGFFPKKSSFGNAFVRRTMQNMRSGNDDMVRSLISRFENKPEGGFGPMGLKYLDKIKNLAVNIQQPANKKMDAFNYAGYDKLRDFLNTLANQKIK